MKCLGLRLSFCSSSYHWSQTGEMDLFLLWKNWIFCSQLENFIYLLCYIWCVRYWTLNSSWSFANLTKRVIWWYLGIQLSTIIFIFCVPIWIWLTLNIFLKKKTNQTHIMNPFYFIEGNLINKKCLCSVINFLL